MSQSHPERSILGDRARVRRRPWRQHRKFLELFSGDIELSDFVCDPAIFGEPGYVRLGIDLDAVRHRAGRRRIVLDDCGAQCIIGQIDVLHLAWARRIGVRAKIGRIGTKIFCQRVANHRERRVTCIRVGLPHRVPRHARKKRLPFRGCAPPAVHDRWKAMAIDAARLKLSRFRGHRATGFPFPNREGARHRTLASGEYPCSPFLRYRRIDASRRTRKRRPSCRTSRREP